MLEKIVTLDPNNYMAKFNLAYLYGFILNKKNKNQKKLFNDILQDKKAPKNIKDKVKESLMELKDH